LGRSKIERCVNDNMNIKAKALFLFFLFFVGSFVAIAQNEVLIEHKGYSVLYSLEYKSPLYVTWTLKKSDLVCPVRYKRKGMNFHKDPLFGGSLDLNKDYKKSGYDKGHMCPAADRACNDTALFDTVLQTAPCSIRN
jgi:endonuclease G